MMPDLSADDRDADKNPFQEVQTMDADTGIMSVGAMRERRIEKAVEDETFRARLFADPQDAVQEELGVKIPDGFTIEVHEEAADTGHLVLPPSAELDEAALEQVAGGGDRDLRS